jgi:Arc/MetJ-type ribon-helix-helix transcriptional regulator
MAKTKTISFPPESDDLYAWLMKQPNQSEAVRRGLELLRAQLEGEPTTADVAALSAQLSEIRRAIEDLRANGVTVEREADEDQAAVDELLRKFGGQE